MVSASPPCAAPNSISAFVAPKTENQVPGGGLCRFRRISTLRSTRQDAQINYLSTLSIFMKQTTYLATLPNFVEFRERYNIGLALGCWHGEPAEEIHGDAGARDRGPWLDHRTLALRSAQSLDEDAKAARARQGLVSEGAKYRVSNVAVSRAGREWTLSAAGK